MNNNKEYNLYATAAFGLEGIVGAELKRLKMQNVRAELGGARFTGTLTDAFLCNLRLRSADRVLIVLAEDECRTFEELFQLVKSIAWEDIMPADAKINVSGKCVRSQLMSVRDCQAITKKAIIERLKAATHRAFFPETGAVYPIDVAIHSDRVRITLDTSGEALNRRGYRTWNGEAPLRETLAASLVELSPWRPGMRLYDPCCGSGGMFVQSAAFVEHHGGNVVQDITIFGQESNPTTWKLAKMNLGIRGIEADLGNYADTFSADQHKNEKFDYVLANPPFNLKNWGGEALQEDVRWKYGMPPTGNANFAWMQHMIWHLNGTGKIGLVLANGSLSSQTSGEGDIRRAIVEDDLVEGIVAMPGQLFYSTQIPVCLWILNKKKAQSGKTLFIDAREMGTMVSRKLREFTEEDINKVASAFDSFRKGEFEPVKGFSAIADLDEIAKQDFILTPGRYVGIAEVEDDGEPFDEKMARLTSEISKCFEESNRLQEQIKKNLEAIGYGM